MDNVDPLIEKAKKYTAKYKKQMRLRGYHHDDEVLIFREKLAQLVIQECLGIVEQVQQQCDKSGASIGTNGSATVPQGGAGTQGAPEDVVDGAGACALVRQKIQAHFKLVHPLHPGAVDDVDEQDGTAKPVSVRPKM